MQTGQTAEVERRRSPVAWSPGGEPARAGGVDPGDGLEERAALKRLLPVHCGRRRLLWLPRLLLAVLKALAHNVCGCEDDKGAARLRGAGGVARVSVGHPSVSFFPRPFHLPPAPPLSEWGGARGRRRMRAIPACCAAEIGPRGASAGGERERGLDGQRMGRREETAAAYSRRRTALIRPAVQLRAQGLAVSMAQGERSGGRQSDREEEQKKPLTDSCPREDAASSLFRPGLGNAAAARSLAIYWHQRDQERRPRGRQRRRPCLSKGKSHCEAHQASFFSFAYAQTSESAAVLSPDGRWGLM